MIVGIHHVALSVPDLDAATRFYVDVLGFTEAFGGEWDDKPVNDRVIGIEGTSARIKMVRASNCFVELWEYRRPSPTARETLPTAADHGYAHICVQVTDIDAEYARLAASGMTFHGPPERLGGGSAAIYGRDPFGNIIEIYEVTGPHRLPIDETTRRLQRLEDVEAIKRLKAAYCASCDDDHNGNAVAELFVPDGTWANSMGSGCTGHTEIRAYFQQIRTSGRIGHSSHMVTNPVIDIDGDEATGTWSFVMVYTTPTQQRFRIVGFYRDRYTRAGGRWVFRSLFAQVQDYARIDATDALDGRPA